MFTLSPKNRGILAVFTLAVAASLANADARITNLRGDTVYVAVMTYTPGHNVILPDGTDMGEWVAPSWRTAGWYPLLPGKTANYQGIAFYVECQGNRIWWSNVREGSGLVHPTLRFDVSASTSQDVDRFVSQGYVTRTFQYLSGNYEVSGDAYRTATMTQSFNFRDRDPKIVRRTILTVPPGGNIYDYSVSGQQRWADGTWSNRGTSLFLDLRLEGGRQPYPGAARDPAYYYGSVTAYFTVPK